MSMNSNHGNMSGTNEMSKHEFSWANLPKRKQTNEQTNKQKKNPSHDRANAANRTRQNNRKMKIVI